jgi:hypothetical protein
VFEVTEAWIKRYRSGSGGWNRAQLTYVGVGWPPPHGWLKETVGRVITDENARMFESLKGQTLKSLRKTTSQSATQSPQAKSKAQFRRELLDWYKQMVSVASQMTPALKAELEAWEQTHLDGTTGTSDWPGWLRYMPPRPRR